MGLFLAGLPMLVMLLAVMAEWQPHYPGGMIIDNTAPATRFRRSHGDTTPAHQPYSRGVGRVYLGLPYAQKLSGELNDRFRCPQPIPADAWKETMEEWAREARNNAGFGPFCPQPSNLHYTDLYRQGMGLNASIDCLSLNVFSPTSPAPPTPPQCWCYSTTEDLSKDPVPTSV